MFSDPSRREAHQTKKGIEIEVPQRSPRRNFDPPDLPPCILVDSTRRDEVRPRPLRALKPTLNAQEWFRDACARAKKGTASQHDSKTQGSVKTFHKPSQKEIDNGQRKLGKTQRFGCRAIHQSFSRLLGTRQVPREGDRTLRFKNIAESTSTSRHQSCRFCKCVSPERRGSCFPAKTECHRGSCRVHAQT